MKQANPLRAVGSATLPGTHWLLETRYSSLVVTRFPPYVVPTVLPPMASIWSSKATAPNWVRLEMELPTNSQVSLEQSKRSTDTRPLSEKPPIT